jgi:hypothetical protein
MSTKGVGRRLVFGRGVDSELKDSCVAVRRGLTRSPNSVLWVGAVRRPKDSFVGAADRGTKAVPARAVRGVNSKSFGVSTGLSSTLGLREPVSYALPRPRTSASSSTSTKSSLMTELKLRMLEMDAFELWRPRVKRFLNAGTAPSLGTTDEAADDVEAAESRRWRSIMAWSSASASRRITRFSVSSSSFCSSSAWRRRLHSASSSAMLDARSESAGDVASFLRLFS